MLNLAKGSRVAILAESCYQWGAAYFGITSAGFIAVPILPDFPQPQIVNILTHSGVQAGITSRKLEAAMRGAVSELPESIPLAQLETAEILDGPGKGTPLARPENPRAFFSEEIAPDTPAVLLYTSGTTGTSKGVTHSHHAIAWNAVTGLGEGLGPDPEGVRHLSVLPLAHTYECTIGLVGILSVGGEIKYLDGPPTPTKLLEAMGKERPSVMLTVPLLMEKIYHSKISSPLKKRPFTKIIFSFPPVRKIIHRVAGKKMFQLFGGNLRFFGIGGAPLAPDTEKFLIESRWPYSVGYGLTETAPLLAGGNIKHMEYRSTGKVLPGVSLRIHEPSEKTGIGEIQAKGPNVMQGYWNDPERTAEVFTEDGWFRTGDLGYIKNNVLFIKGRMKDVLLGSNGENIYPDEVEAVINSQTFVQESLAYINEGQLVARILLDAEKIAAELKRKGLVEAEKINQWKNEQLEIIRKEANKHLGANSRIQSFIEQLSPFEKTPSLKIKRFLYTS
ncbi:MAG: long-chain fatty acid--CoA ligase [Spirochaetales bacterium]|nr:MAG: long-chain fatty acid--CoA ligase [Spirochaetales bacterium]